MEFFQESICKMGDVAVIPEDRIGKISYGTAGFRGVASGLGFVSLRCGVIAALRSKQVGKATGLMITASHNPPADNGIKLSDPTGEMLAADWERGCSSLFSSNNLIANVETLVTSQNIDWKKQCVVLVGQDTRDSSPKLMNDAKLGLEACGTLVIDLGVVTTPQLHYCVKQYNDTMQIGDGPTLLEGYLTTFSQHFIDFVVLNRRITFEKFTPGLNIDCANGVGAIHIKNMLKRLGSCNNVTVNQWVMNTKINHDKVEETSTLNLCCGADHVKSKQQPPSGVVLNQGERYASFDGDADRLIYYFIDKDGTFRLLDGDRIAILLARAIKKLMLDADIASDALTIGVVQTAYANGASTRFIERQGLSTVCTCTGVKHLHHAAKSFDVGVYFEANGHGTVTFSAAARALLIDVADNAPRESRLLRAFCSLFNDTVGDAIADLLAVECALMLLDWAPDDWLAMYEDLPSALSVVSVVDKNALIVTDADRRLVKPEALQERINSLVKATGDVSARCFVRPSGTENCVRVYAEAGHRDVVDGLRMDVENAVFQLGGGVGDNAPYPDRL